MEQAPCPECGQQVGVTKAGLLYKHTSGDGPCPGSGKVVPQVDEADEGADWLDDEPQSDLASGDAEGAMAAGAPGGVAIHDPLPGSSDTYTWHLRVSLPALWLGDAAWHQQNELMAVQQAEVAGCAVTGEAHWDGRPDYSEPGAVRLTYLVPITS